MGDEDKGEDAFGEGHDKVDEGHDRVGAKGGYKGLVVKGSPWPPAQHRRGDLRLAMGV